MSQSQEFKQSLGLLDATMVVVGSMIGSGIFIVSAGISQTVGGAGWLLAAWILTGFLTLTAALSYGELSAMYPNAGGQYVYLREAFGPLTGFLYGWAFFAVIQTGTIAAVGVAFSKFAAYIIPSLSEQNYLIGTESGFHVSAAQLVSIVLIILLTWVNTRGVQGSKIIQTGFTAAKILALVGIIGVGLFTAKADIWQANWANAWDFAKLTQANGLLNRQSFTGVAMLLAFGGALVGSIFSSDAWNNITFIAGEVKNPQKNIGLSLVLGTMIVTAIYLLANVVYLSHLSIEEIAFCKNERVGVAVSQKLFGEMGTVIIAVLIMISTFGCNNGLILSGARVSYTMAKDNLFFPKAGELNANQVPEWGLWVQCIWACALCLSGKYGELLDFVIFVVLLFYILTILGIFILRQKQPNLPRPYKALGYPLLPALYIGIASAICIALLIEKPTYTWPGLGIVLLGIPIYYFIRKRSELQA